MIFPWLKGIVRSVVGDGCKGRYVRKEGGGFAEEGGLGKGLCSYGVMGVGLNQYSISLSLSLQSGLPDHTCVRTESEINLSCLILYRLTKLDLTF